MPQTSHAASIDFGELTEKNIGQLKLLNSTIFPVKYNEKFYTDLLLPEREGLTRLGSKLLQHTLDLCNKRPEVQDIYLHVQVNNDQAIDFYKKFGFEIKETIQNYCIKPTPHTKFTRSLTAADKRIEPPDCYVLQKVLHG